MGGILKTDAIVHATELSERIARAAPREMPASLSLALLQMPAALFKSAFVPSAGCCCRRCCC